MYFVLYKRVSITIESHGNLRRLVVVGSNNAGGGPTKPRGMIRGHGHMRRYWTKERREWSIRRIYGEGKENTPGYIPENYQQREGNRRGGEGRQT